MVVTALDGGTEAEYADRLGSRVSADCMERPVT